MLINGKVPGGTTTVTNQTSTAKITVTEEVILNPCAGVLLGVASH